MFPTSFQQTEMTGVPDKTKIMEMFYKMDPETRKQIMDKAAEKYSCLA